jgi:hypothetical protein
MKSKIAERIMAIPEEAKSLKVEFTVKLIRHGFMKWLEDKQFIQPHRERVLIYYNKMGKPTSTHTTSRKKLKVEIEGEIEIRHNYRYYHQ